MTAFATAEDLQTFLGVKTINSARAEAFLSDASDLIRDYVDQVLDEVSDDVIVFDPSFTSRLFLPQRPVTAVTQVTVNDEAISTHAYAFEPYGVLRRVDGDVWASQPGGIGVTYTHGYAELPGRIVEICKSIAARAYTSVPPQLEGANVVGESAGFAPALFLMPAEKRSLDRYEAQVYA